MKKIIGTALIGACMFGTAYAQSLSKEETKRLKAELKEYSSNLAAYKAKMEDIRITMDSNEAEIKRLKDDLAYAATNQAELDNKVADMDHQLIECSKENNFLKGIPEGPNSVAPKAAPKTADNSGSVSGENSSSSNTQSSTAPMTNDMKRGIVYKVQIGLYKEFNINKYFAEPRYIGYEEVDGMNRYIISYFPDEEIAKNFVADVRKMGIKDAFVSKYIDGKRVYEWSKNPKYAGKEEPNSLEEALEWEKQAKKKKKKEDSDN